VIGVGFSYERTSRVGDGDEAVGGANVRQGTRTGETSGGSRPRRLSPELQVLAGLGSLLALLAGAVGAAVVLIVALENNRETFSEQHVQYVTAIHEAALSAKTMANHERGFLISGDPEFIEELDELTIDARVAFDSADRYAVGPLERDAANESHAGFERWLKALNAELADFRAGSRQRAVETALGPTRQLRKSYERSLERAHTIGLTSIDSASESSSVAAARSVRILLIYLAIALVVGLAIVFWAAHTVLKPTYDLTRSALNVINRSRILVEDDGSGSHTAIAVEVPIEAVNDLAESAIETRDILRASGHPAPEA
jgi:CHASE3 domain sensor protein